MAKIKIDPEFSKLFRKLTKDELDLLEQQLIRDGCSDPLKVWDNDGELILLDGHNRYAINVAAVLLSHAHMDHCGNIGTLQKDIPIVASPAVHYFGPFYYPNSDLAIGTQQFLNTYPSYMPPGYSNYYQLYNPVVLGGMGNYIPPSYYLPGYNNPHFYDPQAQLDLAIASHAYQKSLYNYYNRYYRTYPYY